jgi:hypothetical protein
VLETLGDLARARHALLALSCDDEFDFWRIRRQAVSQHVHVLAVMHRRNLNTRDELHATG